MINDWLKIHKELLAGNYDEWWPSHEKIRTGSAEFMNKFVPTPNFGQPIWNGEHEQITLLVNADFGMGDTIQFYRFIEEAKSRVSKLILRCDEDFKTLFCDTNVVGKDEKLPEFDKVIHMMALPKVLGIKKSDIKGKKYISVNKNDPMDWILQSTLAPMRATKIGICWQGNPFNPRDHLRSMPLEFAEYFVRSFDPRMGFYSLNKIGKVSDAFLDMKPYMGNWNQTAQLIQLMDIVVTVDTAVAHLAGALNRTTYLIIPDEDLDWRWGKEGSETLWYDSVRLYRNKGWAETVREIANDILY